MTRSQVPARSGPDHRYLDGLEERIQDGRGSRALADALARAGIGYVVRRVATWTCFASGAPRAPSGWTRQCDRSPGLFEVASFGRTGFGSQAALVVYQVVQDVPIVEAVERDDITSLSGGPEDIITALESGLLDAARPVVVGTAETLGDSPALVLDGYRKRERSVRPVWSTR